MEEKNNETTKREETVAEIVARWIPHFQKYADPHIESAGFDMAGDAVSALEEISEAWKEERVQDELKWTRIGYEERMAEEKKKAVTKCNGFKLREALEVIRDRMVAGVHDGSFDCYESIDIAEAALAAPPRNCDRFATEEDAYKAWQASRGWTPDVEERCGYGAAWAYAAWLYATAQEGGAK